MANRLTQDALEAITREINKARLTQDALEVAITGNSGSPKIILTQTALEAITRDINKVRLTQTALEVATRELSKIRVTQFAIEIISRVIPPFLVDCQCDITWSGITQPANLTIDCICDINWKRAEFRIDEHDEVVWFTTGASWPITTVCDVRWPGVNNLRVTGWVIAEIDTQKWYPPIPVVLEKCITGAGNTGPGGGGTASATMWTSGV